MQSWFYKSLGDAMTATEATDQIRATVLSELEAAGNPPDLAVFSRSDSDRLHCEISVYFSPKASQIAKAFDAQPCDQPLRKGLDLLAGDPNSWSVLFPETS
jgi:hypothetical protein